MRLSLLLLLLAACAPGIPPDPSPAAPDGERSDRADAARLSEAQALQLVALGVPVVVPTLAEDWTLTVFSADPGLYEGGRFPSYGLEYRRADGTCLWIEGASEGIGDAFVEPPTHQREVHAPAIATYGPLLLGWSGTARPRDLGTEWFGADGLAVRLGSADADGCHPLTPDEAAALLSALRYLDPDDDPLALGPLLSVDLYAPPDGEPLRGPTPEAAVAAFAQVAEEGDPTVTVERLRQREDHAVVLVTTLGLLDDSVRDERVRAVLRRDGDGWVVAEAGRQIRCHEERGSQVWHAQRCL
ncbi:MAG: hypothetical protein R3181_04805 [Rubricoccaceae bacterium]|nr:hypothetical protein [Rubricoccaceae bacterium]